MFNDRKLQQHFETNHFSLSWLKKGHCFLKCNLNHKYSEFILKSVTLFKEQKCQKVKIVITSIFETIFSSAKFGLYLQFLNE